MARPRHNPLSHHSCPSRVHILTRSVPRTISLSGRFPDTVAQVEELLKYKGKKAEVVPGQTSGAESVKFWLKDKQGSLITPHWEFEIAPVLYEGSASKLVGDRADHQLRLRSQVRGARMGGKYV